MAWEKMEGSSLMHNFELKPTLEGLYLKTEHDQGPKKNSDIHYFEVDGEEVKFWGSTVLNGKLAEIGETYGLGKARVQIIFTGMKKSQSGTNYKSYEIAVWKQPETVKVDPVTGEDMVDEQRISPDDVPFS